MLLLGPVLELAARAPAAAKQEQVDRAQEPAAQADREQVRGAQAREVQARTPRALVDPVRARHDRVPRDDRVRAEQPRVDLAPELAARADREQRRVKRADPVSAPKEREPLPADPRLGQAPRPRAAPQPRVAPGPVQELARRPTEPMPIAPRERATTIPPRSRLKVTRFAAERTDIITTLRIGTAATRMPGTPRI